GKIDQTLFIRRKQEDFILVQVYVDDIIFGSTNPQLCRDFEALMHEKFQMSAMGELNFFLGLQVLQKEDDIFLSQDKYVGDILKKFRHQVTPKECHLHAVKRIFRYLKGHPKLGLWYPKESPFDLVAYSDSDYGGATQDHKSTTGGCQFLGKRLISWKCKKQTVVAMLITEAEYVAAASRCTSKFWGVLRILMISLRLIPLGEGSGTPTESYHTPSHEASSPSHTTHTAPSLPPITTTFIPTFTPTKTTPIRQYTRRARIAQSSALPTVADEPASPQRDVSQGEACPTDSGFIADQDRATIAKSPTLPHESTSRVTSFAADEGNLKLSQALEITKLKARVKFLEDRQGEGINLSGDDAPIKRRRLDKEEVATKRVSSDTEEIRLDEWEVATEKVSDDTKEMATVLITIDVASVLSSGGVQVVPTAAAVAPANLLHTQGEREKKMVETHTPKKKKRLQEQIDIQFARELEEELEREAQRMNAQIARDEEIAKIHTEEELQQMIKGLDRSNETIAKHLEEYEQASAELIIGERIELISELVKYQDHHSKILQYQAQQRKTRTKKQKRDFYMAVIKNNLELKRLYEPDVEDHLWTHTQHIMHAPVEWRLYDTCGVHHVMFKDMEIFMLVEKNYPLRKALALVMICYKLQMENYS
nr:putative ribonuclease H-like domain-containing protein [Tanacetum cinerariifolium]